MIIYFLGLPGSGKTYYSVSTIYNNFTDNKDAKKDLKKDYHYCYTNINQFKFNKCENVYELNFDKLYKQLTVLYDLKKNGANDDELIKKSKEFNLYKTLFVFDECHNYFDAQDKILIWWLTYHRHLYHDIFLITQSLSLVNSKYKPLAEAFYKAKPLSLILGNKYFKYDYYIESRLNKASFVSTIKLPKSENVFKLYKSGDSVVNSNVILRFIFITVFLLIVLLSLGYYFYYNTTKELNVKNKTVSSSLQNDVNYTNQKASPVIYRSDNNDVVQENLNDKKMFMLQCSVSTCSGVGISLPPQLLFKFENMKYVHILYKQEISKTLTNVYCSSNKDFFDFISMYKGVKKDEKNIDSLNIFSSSS